LLIDRKMSKCEYNTDAAYNKLYVPTKMVLGKEDEKKYDIQQIKHLLLESV